MTDITQTYRQAMANYLRGAGAPPAIAGLFVDVYNGDPQNGGSSVLATATGSATRPAAGLGAATAAAPSVSSNAAQVQLSASAVGGVTITHIALFDAATGGNLIASKALSSGNQVITAGNPINVPASALQISI